MKPAEARFNNNGNTWMGGANGRHRAWQLRCHKCGGTETVSSNNENSIPPSLVVKRFTQFGWYVGDRFNQDVCPRCRQKRREQKKEKQSVKDATLYDQLLHFADRFVDLLRKNKVREALVLVQSFAANRDLALADIPPESGQPVENGQGFAAWLDELHQRESAS